MLQADGGTRCAAITGGYVALPALSGLVDAGKLRELPLLRLGGGRLGRHRRRQPMLDLAYVEDSRAEVDMNVVISGSGQMIEVQATAERTPFGRASLDQLLSLAAAGNRGDLGAADAGAP